MKPIQLHLIVESTFAFMQQSPTKFFSTFVRRVRLALACTVIKRDYEGWFNKLVRMHFLCMPYHYYCIGMFQ